ncbi:MAG: hypothetical protein AB7F74_30935 [Parvibaculaceae bacterium]
MRVRIVNREFTPAEAATITGVSPALQRDWRRRNLMKENPDGRWTRWTLTDIIELSVMKLFSDAGMDVSNTTIVAHMAVMPTLGALALIDEAVAFEGVEVPEEFKNRIRFGTVQTTDPSHTLGRFLASFGKGEYDVCRTDDLAALELQLDKEPRPILSIVDCCSLARLIAERAGGPVIRYDIKTADDE